MNQHENRSNLSRGADGVTNEEYLDGERKQLSCTRGDFNPCSGEHVELRRRLNKANALTVGWQCLDCGGWRPVKKAQVANVADLAIFDDNLWRVVSDARSEKFRTDYEAEKNAKASAWWELYSKYLGTDKWKKKRAAVLARDGKVCRACLTREAVQAHHLSYEHVGDEPLFDLVAVCVECHDRITRMDRLRRDTGRTPLDGSGI